MSANLLAQSAPFLPACLCTLSALSPDHLSVLSLCSNMSSTPAMDTKTCVGKIHEATDSIASAWLARPPIGHRQRPMWEEGCREEVRKLKELIRQVKEPVSVPPLVLAFLIEHNRAVSAKQSNYNYEAFNPDSTILKAGSLFTRDEEYKIHIKKTGWWTDFGAYYRPTVPVLSAHRDISTMCRGRTCRTERSGGVCRPQGGQSGK